VWWRAAVVLVAGVAALAPVPRPFVEWAYSTGLYPPIQATVTTASNAVAFALLDAAIIVIAGGWLVAFAMDVRRRSRAWSPVLARVAVRTAVWAAALYLAFLVLWGFNYRRTRLADKLQFDQAAVSPETARMVAREAVRQLNTLHDPAHEAGWPAAHAIEPSLAAAFQRAQHELGSRGALVARPKATMFDAYFRLAGVAGMTDPYFLETLVERELLPFERPFVVAHEWSHLAGYAEESEASFVGWLTCVRGSIPDQYSGWLFLYGELARAVGERDRADLAGELLPGPLADLRAITRRLQREVNPHVSAAGWKLYDRYLKANRVEAGAASYDEVVKLVLGVRFAPGWTPRVR
jgi:hypothetical protein